MTRARGLLQSYLLAVVAGLAGLNVWLSLKHIDISPEPPEPPANAGSPSTTGAATATGEVPQLSDLSQTTARPLFRIDRRMPAAAATASSPETAAAPARAGADSLRLIGLMRQGQTTPRALIRAAGQPAAIWVAQGSSIAGWTLGAIESDRVMLERDGDIAELKLFAPKPPVANP